MELKYTMQYFDGEYKSSDFDAFPRLNFVPHVLIALIGLAKVSKITNLSTVAIQPKHVGICLMFCS